MCDRYFFDVLAQEVLLCENRWLRTLLLAFTPNPTATALLSGDPEVIAARKREIEEVLYAHDDIVEAAVIGVPHESHGEEIKAVVVTGPSSALLAEDLIAWCKERLAAYKYPRIVDFMDELPKGPTGKILKRELR